MSRGVITGGILLIFVIISVSLFSSRESGPTGADRSGNSRHQAGRTTPDPQKMLTRTDSVVHAFDSTITAELDSAGNVGAALAVVYRGETMLLRCYGIRNSETGDSVNPHTIFRLASVSKPITGTLAGILDHRKILSLDERVIDHLPGFRLKDSVNTHTLNIRHLLSHTSGLVPHAYDNLVEAGVDFRIILDSLFRVNISAPPGQLYGYQNVLFSIYDTMVHAATGSDFPSVMQEHLFEPVGMHDASVGYQGFVGKTNRAQPHSRGYIREPSERNKRYFLTNPAAGVNASISDLAAFLKAMQGYGPGAVDRSVVDSVLNPVVYTPLRWNYLRRWNSVESRHYALGWRIIGSYGRQVAYHGGYIRGYRAELALCPEEEFGIAFLTNSPGRVGSAVVPRFLDLYFEE